MSGMAAPSPASPADGEWAECLVPPTDPPPDLEQEIRRVVGRNTVFGPRLAHAPWVARAEVRLIDGPFAYLPRALRERIALVVAQDNSCRYCYGVQRALLRIGGHSEADVDRMVRDSHLTSLPPAERAAVDWARRIARASPRPTASDFRALLATGLDRRVALEVAALAAFASFMNRVATLIALPMEALVTLPTSPVFRVVRPLLAWSLKWRRKSPLPPPRPNDGPCARLVAELGDSPTAHVLRSMVDEACASPILPKRTKALVMAVVARALWCAYGEAEARAMLAAEGFGAADADEVLATLASPRLDAREARLVPFARETVRYQAGMVQTRIRAVCRDMTPAEAVELVGIVALANATCRLSAILPDP